MIDITENKKLFHVTNECYNLSITQYFKLVTYFIKQNITVPCNFDQNNTCSKYRRDNQPGVTPYQKIGHNAPNGRVIGCCCYNCAHCKGYLDQVPNGYKKAYTRSFDTDLGFWRPQIGCILPKTLRSITCLTFVCHTYQHLLTKRETSLITAMTSLQHLKSAIEKHGLKRLSIEEQFEWHVERVLKTLY